MVINSGGTRIRFSEKIAQTFLKELIKESPTVSDFIKKNSKAELPIATLRMPHLITDIEEATNNFDTVISIKLRDNVQNDVQSQILSIINKETLLFLNHIDAIEIDSPRRKITFKKKVVGNRVKVESTDILNDKEELKTWTLKRANGIHNDKYYELAIAWNDELNDAENILYSYFKTQIHFPFPALLHGTFELTQDRNQLVNDTEGHNQYLTGKLADLLV